MAGEGRRLGELLVGKGLISSDQLNMVLEEQRGTKEFLGAILVRKGLVRKQDILAALGEQMNVPVIRLDPDRIDWAVAKRFSPTAVLEHKSMPIAMDREAVTVAVVNPLDVWGLEAIEREIGSRALKMVLVSEEDYAQALVRYRQSGGVQTR
ncbi:MAG: hypothetical protein HY598_01580 [Candidatus Omnitrophica bacterium]|nr:hypothetical protein [Candidatus Omnitrophota bacterium]